MKWFATVVIGVLMFSTPALAGIDRDDLAGWGRLSESQRIEIAQIVQTKAEEAVSAKVPSVSVEDVEPWLKVIDHMGTGLVQLAHDLGVEANELVKTPIGMMAMGLIAYHVLGNDVLDIIIGFIWFFVTVPLLTLFFFKAMIPIKDYAEVEVKGWRGPKKVMKPIRRRPCFGDAEGFNVDWIFFVLCVGNVMVTMCIIA